VYNALYLYPFLPEAFQCRLNGKSLVSANHLRCLVCIQAARKLIVYNKIEHLHTAHFEQVLQTFSPLFFSLGETNILLFCAFSFYLPPQVRSVDITRKYVIDS